jgi:hypothetical protein
MLKIPNSAPAFSKMFPDIYPEKQHEINNNWGTKSKERQVNEILTDTAAGNTHFVSHVCADSKNRKFQETLKFFHFSQLVFAKVRKKYSNKY